MLLSVVFHQVVKSLKSHVILQIPELEIPPGLTVITGANGSGKTSLLRILTGIWTACGTIQFDGLPPTAQYRRIGYLQDPPGFYDHLSAYEMLAYYRAIAKQPSRTPYAADLLEQWSIPSGSIRQFSRGQRQRLGIVCSLWHDPHYWLLDEPFTGLDGQGSRLLWETVAHRAQTDSSYTLMVLHPDHGFSAAVHHILVLEAGHVVFFGSPAQFFHRYLAVRQGRVPHRWRTALDVHHILYTESDHPGELLLSAWEPAIDSLLVAVADQLLNPLDLLGLPTIASPTEVS